ncbi:Glucokinase [Lentibacillus sp. JNUCC-1]|uniref:ROK family protein n=1 Tax=Lentibacillus sp. JNUCC-1 TaxID=2654513 RepID=UPI0012E9200D|nr:ROK family protein [Lentibacillus sp. JNUCC-1]MUV37276.1 Glucokinase [Lentibacillus sp. JNUCC-1]
MNWNSVYVISVSVGVTKVSAAVMNLKAEIIDHVVMEETCAEPLIDTVYRLIDQLLEKHDQTEIAGIGVSAPGPIDESDSRMLTPPNLKGVVNLDIKALLEERYQLKTILEKDANAVALAEQWFGHVPSNESILYIFDDEGLVAG